MEATILQGKFEILSPFGMRICADGRERYHQGIDLACAVGTEVRTPVPAIVVNVYEDHYFNRGTTVVLRDILTDDRYSFAYLSEVMVSKGDELILGGVFAKTGDGGATGVPHLHFDRARDCRWMFNQVTRMTYVDPGDKVRFVIPD